MVTYLGLYIDIISRSICFPTKLLLKGNMTKWDHPGELVHHSLNNPDYLLLVNMSTDALKFCNNLALSLELGTEQS